MGFTKLQTINLIRQPPWLANSKNHNAKQRPKTKIKLKKHFQKLINSVQKQ